MDSSPSGSASTNKQAESSASSAPPAGPSTSSSSSSAAAASSSATTQNAPSTANHATQTTDLGSSESSSAAAVASSSGAGSSHTASTETTSVATGTQGTKSTQGTQTPQATEESSSSAGTEDAWTLVSTGAPAAATASATASATTMTGALPSDQEPPSADKAAPAPEDQSTPADGADADDKSEDTEKGDIFKTRQKPGPSSSLTAAEWDGGMDKDDVPADFDPENDDGEDEEEEDTKGGETAEDKKVEKGKGRAVPVQPTKDKAHRSTKKDSTTTGAVEKTEGEKDSEKKEKVTKEPKKLLLIDLPLDVLREIMREVTNTTDLCSLSLSHSSLHALAIPHIYSRFDIVWPDMNIPSERTGVDALTYGLATLVSPKNSYARYIRKFSLGNGPKDWVNEYLINKEGGKMLGTLVSLAIYKMEALETFHWDMPTGVLRDVWMALHELKTVKNVHVRWHDNTHTDVVGSQDPSRRVESPSFSGFKDLKSISSLDVDEVRYMREIATAIEKSYSTLKELRLGVAVHAQTRKWVTDDEASANSSQDGAGEGGIVGLAVGKVCDVKRKPNKPPGEANAANAAGNNESLTQEQLAAALQSQQQQQQQQQAQGTDGQSTPTPTSNNSNFTSTSTPAANTTGTSASSNDTDNTATPTLGTATANTSGTTAPPTTTAATAAATTATTAATSEQASEAASDEQLVPSRQLKLETIEFERIPLSTRVLSKAFDFTSLVNLTLLGCGNHHRLFKLLRKKYSPYPITDKNPSGSTGSSSSAVPTSRAVSIIPPTPNYKLKLKKIHTDSVSPSLLSFINQTLAPNTLETLFLQEHQDNEYSTPTALNLPQLPLRRHRLSLKRILIDSYVENPDSQPQNQNNPTTPTVLSRKSKWKFNRETLTFLTERMPNLKEAGFTIDYKDWHFFLTRLPEMGSLRSLYLPHVIVSSGPDVHNPERQAEEMAMQIVDVVTLRPECGICYVGILNKCFELLESDESSSSSSSSSASSAAGSNATNTGAGSGAGGGGNAANANAAQAGAEVSEDEDDDDDEDGDDDGDEEGDDDDEDDEDEGDDTEDAEEGEEDQDVIDGEAAAANAAAAAGIAAGGINHNAKDDDGDGDAADHGPRNKRIRIKHREILFYEDKVAVFKARHARL